MTRTVCRMDMKLNKEQAKATFNDIIEGFELDMLDKESMEFKTIEAGLLPAIMRGRIEVDVENYKIKYHLKTPITFPKDPDANPIKTLHFSIGNSKLKNVKAMTKAADDGNPKPLIFQYCQEDTTGLDVDRQLDSISHGDALSAGGIGALFLAF
jgi:hypothetical protein